MYAFYRRASKRIHQINGKKESASDIRWIFNHRENLEKGDKITIDFPMPVRQIKAND
jgi:DUF1680 family protein